MAPGRAAPPGARLRQPRPGRPAGLRAVRWSPERRDGTPHDVAPPPGGPRPGGGCRQDPRPSGAAVVAALAAVPVVPVLAVHGGGVVGHVGLHLARRAYVALGRRAA